MSDEKIPSAFLDPPPIPEWLWAALHPAPINLYHAETAARAHEYVQANFADVYTDAAIEADAGDEYELTESMMAYRIAHAFDQLHH